MSTPTTLKLPDELKARIARLAKAAGITPHALMVQALGAQAELAERRHAFVAAALAAEEEMVIHGLGYDAEEVFSYLRDKAAGQAAERPAPRQAAGG